MTSIKKDRLILEIPDADPQELRDNLIEAIAFTFAWYEEWALRSHMNGSTNHTYHVALLLKTLAILK